MRGLKTVESADWRTRERERVKPVDDDSAAPDDARKEGRQGAKLHCLRRWLSSVFLSLSLLWPSLSLVVVVVEKEETAGSERFCTENLAE